MKLLEIYSNTEFQQKIRLSRCFTGLPKIPRRLSAEIESLAVKDSALFIAPEKRTRAEIISLAEIDPTVERWEFSLNKRHLADFVHSKDTSVDVLFQLFVSASLSIREKAWILGFQERICFCFSSPMRPKETVTVASGTTMTFYRLVDEQHVIDPGTIEEFSHDLVALVII